MAYHVKSFSTMDKPLLYHSSHILTSEDSLQLDALSIPTQVMHSPYSIQLLYPNHIKAAYQS